MANKIKLFIVDDSAIVRNAIRNIVKQDKNIELLGVASDPLFAEEKFKKVGLPDVIILDLEMPRMDGLTFLKKIIYKLPIAVIICSGYADKGSLKAVEALSLGAVDIIEKPKFGVNQFIKESERIIIASVYAAAKSKTIKINNEKKDELDITKSKFFYNDLESIKAGNKKNTVIVIGSSTGGVQVLDYIISLLNPNTPPILIVQHMPEGFTKSLAERLNRKSDLIIKEAENGDFLKKGLVLIAPGGKQMVLAKNKNDYIVKIVNGPKVNHHRPSVGVLFNSCVRVSKEDTIAFILTGMSNDGSYEIKQIKDCGGKTYAQDEASCVVFGMPKEAINNGGIDKILTPYEIAMLINRVS